MGQKYMMQSEKASDADFRTMEVVTVKKRGNSKGVTSTQALLVDNHWETLRYVQENMDDFVNNLIKVKRLEEQDRIKMEESSKLFEENLDSLFGMISKTSKNNVMEKLSISLKKALILMAMDRYHCDRKQMCNALGITSDRLEEEMALCGLKRLERAA